MQVPITIDDQQATHVTIHDELPNISGSMLDRKLNAIAASGAERLVSCDLGCLLHLEGGLRRRGAAITTQHLAELIDEALK